jgi:hypothetical protein
VFYSKRERLVLFRAELFKACKKCFFFVSVTLSQNRAVFSVFFPPASLSFFGSGRTDKNTNSESDIIYIINAHKNGGYKRTNVSEREREEMNNASSSVVLSFFLFFLCFCFFLKRRG